MDRKNFELKKLDDDGSGLAQIATLSAIDHDGDTYAKGAFGTQPVIILAGHSWAGVPLGKGRVYEKDDNAFAEFKLNLDTTAGKDWHEALKFDMANGDPLQEWSYGFKVLDSSEETRDGKAIRILKQLEVFEVSPVVKGAGMGTHTVAVKSRPQFLTDVQDVIAFAERLAVERKAEGQPFRQAWLLEITDLRKRLDSLLETITEGKDVNDPAEAERLLAEFTAISVGQFRRNTP